MELAATAAIIAAREAPADPSDGPAARRGLYPPLVVSPAVSRARPADEISRLSISRERLPGSARDGEVVHTIF